MENKDSRRYAEAEYGQESGLDLREKEALGFAHSMPAISESPPVLTPKQPGPVLPSSIPSAKLAVLHFRPGSER